ncbi:Atg14 domain-containing protein [Bryobacter aggregatus]|uniref:Atg14 domain-containing protein n=1 Tax=Bryobacter aggregatus TaxID=360054 RepID=UPI001EE3242D|nr:Atg14 domain-containing protein [Bryobacter aggregatus]
MRQSLFSRLLVLCLALPALASTPAIEKAKQDLARLRELATIGAVSRARLLQAEDALGDAQDEDTLHRLLYGSVGVEQLSEGQTQELLAAAQRRVERVAKTYGNLTDLVQQGVIPKSHIEDLELQLKDRRLALQLAENRAHIFQDLLNMAKAEELLQSVEPQEESAKPLVESFTGSGVFKDAHLKYVESAFQKQFHRPLPITAQGQSNLHTSFGFDHSGRVDVGVNPDDAEGKWLRSQLQTLRIPYIALRAMIPGQSTGPHIHIGLPSLRLKVPDLSSGNGAGGGLH